MADRPPLLCAECGNAETFNNPDPWTRLGRWLADREHGPRRGWDWSDVTNPNRRFISVRLYEGIRITAKHYGEGQSLEEALSAALDRAEEEAKRNV